MPRAVIVALLAASFLTLHVVHAVLGIDVSSDVADDKLACLRRHDYGFVVVRSYRSIGDVDPNAPRMLRKVRDAGMTGHIYHFPCVQSWNLTSAYAQVAHDVRHALSNGSTFSHLFFDVEPFRGPCSWPADKTKGCAFLGAMITAAEQLGLQGRLGIYASQRGWAATVGANCTVGADRGLVNWYAAWPRPEVPPSFDGWRPFGGWVTPFMRQYNDSTPACELGAQADANWTPYWPEPQS